MTSKHALPITLFALLPLAACASYPVPTERLANTTAAIRGAQEVGASGTPQAALHLKYAEEELARAKRLVADGNNERAEAVAANAQSDAELSLALTREAAATLKSLQVADKARNDAKRP
jgi:type III secretion system FlhB-like substrate exporter